MGDLQIKRDPVYGDIEIVKGSPDDGNAVEKSGEGSRGGTIIGHTSTGRPVYAHKHGDHRRKLHDFFQSQNEMHAKAHYEELGNLTKKWDRGIDFNQIGEERQKLLKRLPHIAVTDDGFGAQPAFAQTEGTEFVTHHPQHGTFYVNTEGFNYARYKTSLRNYPSFKWPKKTKKAAEPADVEKAAEPVAKAGKGEGTRGGHVIGHTRSGKPIYGSGHYRNLAIGGIPKVMGELVTTYNMEDHADAKRHHEAAADKWREMATKYENASPKSYQPGYSDMHANASIHDMAAQLHGEFLAGKHPITTAGH